MTQHDTSSSGGDPLAAALARLTEAGTLSPTQAEAVRRAVAEESATAAHAPEPLRAVRPRGPGLAEIAGYAGGALVVAAAALFVADFWSDLTDTARALWLAGAAAVLLLAAGMLATRTGTSPRRLRDTGPDGPAALRRLVGTLVGLAAGGAAGAAGVAATGEGVAWAGAVGLLVAGAGWVLVPTAVGALTTWAASLLLVGGLVDAAGWTDELAFGLVFGALGLGWAALALAGAVRDRLLVLVLGLGTALVGAQVTGAESTPVQYATTAALAVLGFALYARVGSWPLVALGVVGVTLAVPEAVGDWTDGNLGAAGGVLVAGVALLVASAVGIRLRRAAGHP